MPFKVKGKSEYAFQYCKERGQHRRMEKLKNWWRNNAYLNNLRITMLFSHRDKLDLLDTTISGMKLGQAWGHSCFKIYNRVMKSESLESEYGLVPMTS